mmetsp:Transcript_11588/g.35905  ORF Transcript_11588/g.35905 Transcript_11588/m.35905 type:complete len:273 (-) Transcript_11588:2282-3100(-)|eukprot:scaffold125183_cov27-Tisochrysis_lutea.AAC.2
MVQKTMWHSFKTNVLSDFIDFDRKRSASGGPSGGASCGRQPSPRRVAWCPEASSLRWMMPRSRSSMPRETKASWLNDPPFAAQPQRAQLGGVPIEMERSDKCSRNLARRELYWSTSLFNFCRLSSRRCRNALVPWAARTISRRLFSLSWTRTISEHGPPAPREPTRAMDGTYSAPYSSMKAGRFPRILSTSSSTAQLECAQTRMRPPRGGGASRPAAASGSGGRAAYASVILAALDESSSIDGRAAADPCGRALRAGGVRDDLSVERNRASK